MTKKRIISALEQYHESSYMWALQCCKNDHDLAKDIMQDVYEKILRRKAIYHQRSGFKTWLFAVIRNTAYDAQKKTIAHEALNINLKADKPTYSEESSNMKRLLSMLSEQQAKVLLLVFYHNQTLEEVAEVMGLSIGSIRTHYDRGKKNIRKLLNKDYHG